VCGGGDLCNALGTCYAGNIELVFWSDWRTATGSSGNAVFDGGEWTGSAWNNGLEVVSASGLGFPVGMDNVLDGYKGGNTGGDVSRCDGWQLPQVGEAVAFRLYMRHGAYNPGGDLPFGSNHPIEAGAGDLAYTWSWKWGLRSNDNINDLQMTFLNDGTHLPMGGEHPPGTVLIMEWSFERVTNSTWRARAKVSDSSYNTLAEVDTGGKTISGLERSAGNIACGSSTAARSLFVGWNGPGGWNNVTGHIHWGGVAVAITTPGQWIGPYPAGPEAN
jgi:hypothetical protein